MAALSVQQSLPMLLLSILGSAVFVGLLLCVRRFDAEQGDDGDDDGGHGGDHPPPPDQPSGPLTVVDPPLGEIRATRKRDDAVLDGVLTRE